MGSYQKPKRKQPGFAKNLLEYLSEYTDKASIHGVRYVGEKKRSILERLCWVIVLSVALYFCIALTLASYHKWKNSPGIVNFSKKPSPIWQIPFPAITVCPETKSRQRVYNFTAAYQKSLEGGENMTAEELWDIEQASLVCDSHLHPEGNKTIENDAIEFLSKIAPQFEDVLWQCKWINQNHTCYDLFTPILTEEGICFTFNILDREELFTNKVFFNGDYLQHGMKSEGWTMDKGYPKDHGIDTYPRRAVAAGQKACLSLLMTLYEQDMDYVCRGPVQGFKILLHNPTEVPRVSQHYFRAPLNQELVVSITPEMMTTSEGLKGYDPENRHCFFPHERQLRYFQVYTQHNCEVECLTNYTLKKCGCVSYHMPHTKDTDICGAGSTVCVHEANVELTQKEVELSIETFGDGSETKNEACNCLPACTSLSYNSESSQAYFNWPEVFKAFKVNFSEFPGVAMTRVTFFFKEQQFTPTERNEFYSFTDFLGNLGGLLALFLGLSFLSIIEIIYFLTLRLFVNIKKYGRHFWSGSIDLLKDSKYDHDDYNFVT